jgi:hypothetical protein
VLTRSLGFLLFFIQYDTRENFSQIFLTLGTTLFHYSTIVFSNCFAEAIFLQRKSLSFYITPGEEGKAFFALSVSIDAKRTVKMVKKKDLGVVRNKALAYQAFQQGLAKIRKTNKEIDTLLEQLKQQFLEQYK